MIMFSKDETQTKGKAMLVFVKHRREGVTSKSKVNVTTENLPIVSSTAQDGRWLSG